MFTRKILCKYLLLSLWIRQSIHKITEKTYKLLFLVELVIAGSEIWVSFFDTNSRQDDLGIRIFRISSNFLFDCFYLFQIKLVYHCKLYLTCCATGSRMASIVFVWNTGIVILFLIIGTIWYLRENVSIAYKLPQIQLCVEQQRLQVDKHLISRITTTTYYR